MKTNLLTGIFSFFFAIGSFAQDKTTVTANSSDISDNLDLRAVATIFGDAADLEDFERRLNDPKAQISNLDLNNDNYVDYLRVIESIEGSAHIIVIQAVLDKDIYQDVASIEVERDNNNNVQVQVVGDVYMYGANYIYEPVYVHRPIIYTTFWVSSYRPYCSSWYWNYYPTYYTYWRPFPIFRYRNHIAVHINFGHSYHYVTTRRCSYAYNAYYGRRANGYERRYPNRSFSHRNSGYSNRYEMDQNRSIRTRVPGSRELAYNNRTSSTRGSRNNSEGNTRNYGTTRSSNSGTSTRNYSSTRDNSNSGNSPRSYSSNRSTKSITNTPRNTNSSVRSNSGATRSYEPNRNSSSRANTSRNTSTTRNNATMNSSRSANTNRGNTTTRSGGSSRQSGSSSSRGNSSGRGNSNRGGRI
ncbi:hypothetical protein GOQ30_02830 [Flavobacterium sp. TP390]|uniref:DUF3300 domain-containing protein n=1 Tax=Flavobacterium profundi TaxID=1774945 RepID=A0A6I4IRZ8_9FLAO|nr:hypothetical protein [Flavobacterium profundi]MVO08097.1 hypothetical protein [Flavobacterium profundi]